MSLSNKNSWDYDDLDLQHLLFFEDMHNLDLGVTSPMIHLEWALLL